MEDHKNPGTTTGGRTGYDGGSGGGGGYPGAGGGAGNIPQLVHLKVMQVQQ